MAERCIECRINKKRVYFDIDKARTAAKQLAIEKTETYALYKDGKTIAFTSYATASAAGYDIIELVSKHL